MSKYKIGHPVYIEGVTSMANGGGKSKIDSVDVKYDPDTGEPFNIYLIDGKWWTEKDGYGGCYDNPNYMYDVDYNYFEKYFKLTSENIDDIVYDYPTEFEEGFTAEDIKSIGEKYGIESTDIFESIGVCTMLMKEGKGVTFHSDVALALRCIVEGRDKHPWEWD
jgi:hypothetical protein